MDRIDKIKDLQKNGLKVEKKQSIVINNFFSIITIVMVCLSILYYTAYVVPAQEAKKQREDKIIAHNKHLQKRAKQIALSHKLNNQNQKSDNNASKK